MSEAGNGMGKVVFQNIYSIMLKSCDQNRQIVEKLLIGFIKDVTHWKWAWYEKKDFSKRLD